jgi:hypothetical protein
LSQGCYKASSAVSLPLGFLFIRAVINFFAYIGSFLNDEVIFRAPPLTASIVYWVFPPVNGISPVNITKAIAPTLHKSQLKE